eukprot:TRINITY_DN112132_c0_g1_i1.p1 TRINITY_DN112132_c0_g1~~TRINITY_DN112132_c0_g1_i1.p1  ORF type:complete len:371 (+),score=96.65 TRINITY_DN112132_c0_g1_i1:95-1207(+)
MAGGGYSSRLLHDMLPPERGDVMRPPVPSDDSVRCTHVDAALAKMSCAKLGYFEDRFTELLVRNSRPPSRSPLIHRGYYSRVVAMRQTVLKFLKECPPGGCQIVNLGAGMDSLFFWLRDSEERWREDLVCFEVDFPEVLSRKLHAIQKKPELFPLLGVSSPDELVGSRLSASSTQELRTKHLRFVSTDMRIEPELAEAVANAGLRPNLPTMFISECVLVYMQAMHGSNIIQWAANCVPAAPAVVALYEQCNPDDRFGKVMVDNLHKRGCPLLSIHDFPSMESQRQRFVERGWQKVAMSDMNGVYSRYLDQEDVARISKIEMMDEFEEWHLIQGHYFLLVASKAAQGAEGDAAASSWAHNVGVGLDPPPQK